MKPYRWLTPLALALAVGSASGAETLTIGPSASRLAKETPATLYKMMVSGDRFAARAWQGRTETEKVKALAEISADSDKPAARQAAVHDLAKLTPSEDSSGVGLKALARVAVAESDGVLRAYARDGLVSRGDSRTTQLLGMALRSNDQFVRTNAADTLVDLGGPAAVEVVVERFREVIGGGGPRGHVFIGQVRSYVADYDISGDSYDPVVKQFFTGSVLDTRVISIEREIIVVTLRRIGGGIAEGKRMQGPDDWAALAQKEQKALNESAAEKQRAAAERFAAASALVASTSAQ